MIYILSPTASFTGFPHPALLSPTPFFSPMVTHPHHAFSIHPAAAARSFLVMPSGSPASFAIPPFLPRLPSSPGRFVFPSGPGTLPPHLPTPSSLLLHSLSPPGPMPLPQFPVFLSQPPGRSQPSPPTDSSDTEADTSTPPASPTIPHDKHIYREYAPASPESPLPIQKSTDSFPPEEQGYGLAMSEATPREESTFRYRRYSTDGGEPIDVETPDQEEGETMMDEHERDVQPFLGIRCPHRKQRKRRERKMRVPDAPYPLEKTRQTRRTPMKHIAGTNDAPRNLAEGHSTSRDRFSLKGPELLINDAIEQGAEQNQFHLWKRREVTSPLAIDLAPRLPTVICS